MTVGERIKNRREALNMSQDELAKKVGYKSRSSINKIETSRDLPLNKVEKMALALECSPAYLMGWTEDIIEENTPLRAASKIDGDVAKMFLQQSLLDEIKPTNFELDIILAYRASSEARKEMVRLALDIQDKYEKEKKDGNIKEGTR